MIFPPLTEEEEQDRLILILTNSPKNYTKKITLLYDDFHEVFDRTRNLDYVVIDVPTNGRYIYSLDLRDYHTLWTHEMNLHSKK